MKQQRKLRKSVFYDVLILWICIAMLSSREQAYAQHEQSSRSKTLSETSILHVPGQITDIQTAINEVSDGGLIVLAAGTYPVAQGGLRILNLHKGFKIQAAPGAKVVLDGQVRTDLIRIQNTDIQ
ncbi:MAG: hypothetical protein P1S60_08835, partial [Anaerolineae bacterium]|nr:hypothetical protein [Anaerolineae bacterium]